MIGKGQAIQSRLKTSNGFTMIEIIAVLIVLSIITAVIISRGMTSDEVKLQAEFNTMKGHLRFAQSRAMNELPGIRWGINVAGASYTLVRFETSTNTATNPMYLPGESSATHYFTSGITASVTGSNPVLFDEWGSPGTAVTSVSVGNKVINVTPNTGFIE